MSSQTALLLRRGCLNGSPVTAGSDPSWTKRRNAAARKIAAFNFEKSSSFSLLLYFFFCFVLFLLETLFESSDWGLEEEFTQASKAAVTNVAANGPTSHP